MSYWKETTIDLDKVQEDKIIPIVFQGNVGIPEIVSMFVSCGCLKVKYDNDTKTISGVYKAGKIPNHLANEQEIMKHITVTYKDGNQDILYIQGTKIK